MPKTYSYAELKGIIRVGDKVRACPDKNNPCFCLRKDGSNTGKITKVTEEYFEINHCDHEYAKTDFLVLNPCLITWENIHAGDFIKNEDDYQRKILARVGDCLFVSSIFINDDDSSFQIGHFFGTTTYFQNENYTIVQPKEQAKTTLTKAKIAEKLGIKVEDLNIED